MQLTDRELVELTLTGDLKAFDELMKRYQGLILSLAYHQVRSFADAQEVSIRRKGQIK